MGDELDPAEKLRLALDMHEAGVSLMRQNLLRAHPSETAEEIEHRIGEWLAAPDVDEGAGALRPAGPRLIP